MVEFTKEKKIMNAAYQILMKQLKHLEEQETALKVKTGTLNTELMELGEEQAGLTQSINQLKEAIDFLTGVQSNVRGSHKEGKEDNGKRSKSKKAK